MNELLTTIAKSGALENRRLTEPHMDKISHLDPAIHVTQRTESEILYIRALDVNTVLPDPFI